MSNKNINNMNLKTPLTLNIFWNTPEATQLLDLGIEISDERPETRECIFFTIDNISGYSFNWSNKVFGCICSGGDEYISELTYEELKTAVIALI